MWAGWGRFRASSDSQEQIWALGHTEMASPQSAREVGVVQWWACDRAAVSSGGARVLGQALIEFGDDHPDDLQGVVGLAYRRFQIAAVERVK